jgi:HAD superfamily hydrolase (TIGR01509 family)
VPPRKLRAIIFDIGRVLIRMDVPRAVNSLGANPALSPDEVWTALQKDPRWADWQEGRMSPQNWHLHVTKRLGSPLDFEQFSRAWNLALDPEPLHDSGLFAKLAKHYRLGLLSNTDPIHVTHMEARYDFFRYFPVRTYSCQAGASKPSPLIFRAALRASRVKAEEAVFIDDIAAYVEAAQRLGIAGIHFRVTNELPEQLRELGIQV